jgi:NAD(P)-dependent dehydrogenase (short-subunit alcohol dehydrogenase family)
VNLKDQRILVIGGSSGMGLASARRLAEAGAAVIIAGRTQSKLEAALAGLPGSVSAQALDFTDRASLDRAMAAVGRLDHLVLSGAGRPAWGKFLEVDVDALRRALESKLIGYWNALQAVVPVLRRDGSATLLTGAASRATMPGTAGLAAVNGAINRLGRTLSKELAPLRVNVISPGLVDTPAYDGMPAEARRAMFQGAAASLPVGRTGVPDDVADAVLFMVANGFTTGAILDVDGGAR